MAGSKTEVRWLAVLESQGGRGLCQMMEVPLNPRGLGLWEEMEGQCLIRAEDRWGECIGETRV